MSFNRKLGALFSIVLLAIGSYTIAVPLLGGQASAQADDTGLQITEFEVAENATRFVFDEAPVFDDGLPAYGNTFITQGYIYPAGTLNGNNGVLPDGRPEFPDKVIGTWVCRGWFIGDGAHTETGPIVITSQLYQFGEAYGNATIVTDGFELPEVNTPIKRAITGGTAQYKDARGEVTQTLLGFTEDMAVNLHLTLEIEE